MLKSCGHRKFKYVYLLISYHNNSIILALLRFIYECTSSNFFMNCVSLLSYFNIVLSLKHCISSTLTWKRLIYTSFQSSRKFSVMCSSPKGMVQRFNVLYSMWQKRCNVFIQIQANEKNYKSSNYCKVIKYYPVFE